MTYLFTLYNIIHDKTMIVIIVILPSCLITFTREYYILKFESISTNYCSGLWLFYVMWFIDNNVKSFVSETFCITFFIYLFYFYYYYFIKCSDNYATARIVGVSSVGMQRTNLIGLVHAHKRIVGSSVNKPLFVNGYLI